MLNAQGANDAWLKIMMMLKDAQECSPRGMLVKELRNFSLCITNPKKRIVTNPMRKMSLPYAFGEFLWYMSGRNCLNQMEYYAKKMANFSDDGKTLNSAYGYRIFGHHPELPFDQWDDVVQKLALDPDSRQAIIHLHTPNNKPTKDEVCTLTLQFMIRGGKLEMYVNMRSNDIVWGFTYDVFSFTSMQELMANELGIPMGNYYHNAASMHIYSRDFDMLERVTDQWQILQHFTRYDKEFSYGTMTRHSDELQFLIDVEECFRVVSTGCEGVVQWQGGRKVSEATMDFLHVFNVYTLRKLKKPVEYDFGTMVDVMLYNQFTTSTYDRCRALIIDGCEAGGKTTHAKEELFVDNSDYIHLGPPDKNFTPQIYMNIIFSGGNKVIDRFVYSEVVYSAEMQRPTVLGKDDLDMLEKAMKEADVEIMFFVFDDIENCICRLSEEDKGFTLPLLTNINEGFRKLASERSNKKAYFKPYVKLISVEEHEKNVRFRFA